MMVGMGRPITPMTARLWARVTITPGCWLWQGWCTPDGYGMSGGQLMHRKVWEHYLPPLAEGLTFDHLCMVPRCVNPDHLEGVPAAENNRRARAARGRTNLCKNGHELTDDNTFWQRNKTKQGEPVMARLCRQCKNERAKQWQRDYAARKKAARATAQSLPL